MESRQSPLVRFTLPLSGTFAVISRVTVEHFVKRAYKARLAHDVKILSLLDHCILSDIGMHGFNQLSPKQQEAALIERFRQKH